MKNTQTCSKCNSKNIIRIPGIVGPFNSGNNIWWGFFGFNVVKVTRYMCCECGYSEEWIDDKNDIKKLQKKFR